MFPSFVPRLALLLRDRRGSSPGIMAAGLIVGVGSLGSAIDAGRMHIVKSQLQAGVDAAALAGARLWRHPTALATPRRAEPCRRTRSCSTFR